MGDVASAIATPSLYHWYVRWLLSPPASTSAGVMPVRSTTRVAPVMATPAIAAPEPSSSDTLPPSLRWRTTENDVSASPSAPGVLSSYASL